MLEHDEALHYYRSIQARYGSDDNLIATYTPVEELFSDAVLADLQALRTNSWPLQDQQNGEIAAIRASWIDIGKRPNCIWAESR